MIVCVCLNVHLCAGMHGCFCLYALFRCLFYVKHFELLLYNMYVGMCICSVYLCVCLLDLLVYQHLQFLLAFFHVNPNCFCMRYCFINKV